MTVLDMKISDILSTKSAFFHDLWLSFMSELIDFGDLS